MRNLLVLFTDKLGMYTYRLINKEDRAYIERVDVEAPAQVVREALSQKVSAVARRGAEHYFLAMNGTIASRSVGSKIWAFDGTNGTTIASERFIREITDVDPINPKFRGGSNKISIKFLGPYSRKDREFFSLATLADDRVCRSLKLKKEECE